MGEALRAGDEEIVGVDVCRLVHPLRRQAFRLVVAVHHLGDAATLRVRAERLQLDELRVVDPLHELPRLFVHRIDRHLATRAARVLEGDPDLLRGLRLRRYPQAAFVQELGDVHHADAVELVVELERPIAFGARGDERLHPEHLDDLRVVLPHPLEDVDLALPQLVVAAALHERSVQDHRLDADGAQQLDRRIEDDPVIRVAVVHVRELHLDVVVVDAARVVRVT